MSFHHFKIILVGFLLMGMLFGFARYLQARAASHYTVYFYSSETNINNFSSLKLEFDTYLSNFGAYQFQPFKDRKTFENFIVDKQDGVFLLSSWHWQSLKNTLPMTPVLVGVSKGKSTQKRVLSVKKGIASVDLLAGGTVASAGSEDFSRTVLMQMLGYEHRELASTIEILTVPKDIDALMAVGFDMAQAALTTESSLAKLAAINPVQYGLLIQLATSEEALLPIVAAPASADEHIQTLLGVIEGMGDQPEGGQKLRMLGLDGWKKLDAQIKRMLERR